MNTKTKKMPTMGKLSSLNGKTKRKAFFLEKKKTEKNEEKKHVLDFIACERFLDLLNGGKKMKKKKSFLVLLRFFVCLICLKLLTLLLKDTNITNEHKNCLKWANTA